MIIITIKQYHVNNDDYRSAKNLKAITINNIKVIDIRM